MKPAFNHPWKIHANAAAQEKAARERDKMRHTAFLVGFFDTTTGKFLGFGVFSEESPTTSASRFPFVVLRGRGNDYEEGLAAVGEFLRSPGYEWMVRHVSDGALNSIAEATARVAAR